MGYIRVSTEKQANEGTSLEAQQAKLTAYAKLYDLDLIAIESDDGESAKTLNRPGLQRALASLVSGESEAILVTKLDRLTRSVRDLGALLEGYFIRYALLSVTDQIDTRSATGRLLLNILTSVAQWEREACGERTSAVMQHMRAMNRYTGGPPPYGWSLENGALVANPAEQATITAARLLRQQGMSLSSTGRSLTRMGCLPRTGATWHPEQIKILLAAKTA